MIALFLMLLCIGLLMVLSASGVVAERINGDKYFFFKRQLIYAVIGGVVMWVLEMCIRDRRFAASMAESAPRRS